MLEIRLTQFTLNEKQVDELIVVDIDATVNNQG